MSTNNHKNSDTLSQRDKARRDFLELKEMQRKAAEGEVEEHVAYSGEIKPKTVKEKVSHFFYYYGKATVIILLLLALVTFATVSCLNKENPDLKILIYDNRILADMLVGDIEDYFEKYCPDYNGDGEVVVRVINCTYETGVSTAEYQQTMMQRLQGTIVSDSECMLIITSPDGYDYISGIIGIEEQGLMLPESYYNCTEGFVFEEGVAIEIPKGMSLYCRNIKGELKENDKTAKKAVERSKEFIEIMSEVK